MLPQRVHVHVSKPSIRSTVCAFDLPHFWQWGRVKRDMVPVIGILVRLLKPRAEVVEHPERTAPV
jgi:hypothetical protein